MHSTGRICLGTLGAAFLTVASLTTSAGAQEGHDHGRAPHGGVEVKTRRHNFEAVFTKAGMRLYAHGSDHEALDVSRLSATATFYHPATPGKPWFSRALKPISASPGGATDSLGLAIDLAKVPAKGVKVSYRVTGLADPSEPEASFTVPLTFASGGELAVAKATAADQKAIEALKFCPVSHEDLGSMGTPLKVTRGDRTTFLCCKGCLKELQANPDKFLGAAAKGSVSDAKHDHHAH